jgi:hypothetical protein
LGTLKQTEARFEVCHYRGQDYLFQDRLRHYARDALSQKPWRFWRVADEEDFDQFGWQRCVPIPV